MVFLLVSQGRSVPTALKPGFKIVIQQLGHRDIAVQEPCSLPPGHKVAPAVADNRGTLSEH